MAENNNITRIAGNKQIDEYFKVVMQGLLSAGTGYRDDLLLTRRAMEVAMTMYKYRCNVLGQTYSKNLDE